MARIKTRYVGVYYRYGMKRFLPDGRQDKCFDIQYRANGKYVWEKIGWQSEGYTVNDAIEIRGLRVKSQRHPELVETKSKQIENKIELTMSSAWQIYQKNWMPNLKQGKHFQYIYNRYIGEYFGNKQIKDITSFELEKFKQYLFTTREGPKSSLKASSVKYIISCLMRIINKMLEWQLVEHNTFKLKVNVPNSDSKRERFLTKQEVSKLFDGLYFTSCKAFIIANIALHTGLRISEITTLKVEAVDLNSGVIYITGKTGRRCAYIPDSLKNFMKQIISNTTTEYMFATPKGNTWDTKKISTIFSSVANDIGLNSKITDNVHKVVFHTLRHTFCSWLAIEGVPLYTIGELVGHRSINMTKRYAKLSPDHKKEAINIINIGSQ